MWKILAIIGCICSTAAAECYKGTSYHGYDKPIIEVKYFRDCQEALDKGVKCSGVYTIKPDHLPPFEASDNIL